MTALSVVPLSYVSALLYARVCMSLPAAADGASLYLCAIIINSQKQVPTSEVDPAVAREFPVVIERQCGVDVSKLQQRITAAGPQLWDPAHQKANVPIQRAGHDKWGIGKVVFIFCDDYIRKVYTFPWFHEWRAELEPIFAQIGIPVERVVRCILACMPPDSVVPVHHDTGAWVSKSHRMHIPIFTDASIDFQVGHNEQSMTRHEFKQGNLYELNNASKHCVHNHWTHPRVHMIFDYVEDAYPLSHMTLTSDMVLHQTRRTLDLSTDYGSRSPPSFMVIGAQKAGTTSLYDYITQHDLAVSAKRKETHYFDWRWNAKLPASDSPEGAAAHCAYYHNFFEKDVLMKCPSLMTGEATPSYLLGGSVVIDRMQQVIPHCRKILVIMRNPVDRAYSHYCMTADTEGNAQQLRNRGHHHLKGRTFEQIIDGELEELSKLGVHPDMDFDEFDEKVLRSRVAFDHGAHSYVLRGLYELQLIGWTRAFGADNVLLLTLDEMKTSEGLHTTMDKVFEFLELPPHRIEDISAKNTRKYEPLLPATRAKLAAFYAPYNQKLNERIGRDLGW
ncbi:Glucosamine 3-sulfotransferase 1, partial [Globisporangium splendens]